MADHLMHEMHVAYRMDETDCVENLIPLASLPPNSIERIQTFAKDLVLKVRNDRLKQGGLDAFLYEYDLSSEEGIALMCMAEALLRIPDPKTRDRLIKDKIMLRDWEKHLGNSHSWFVNAGTLGLMLTGKIFYNPGSQPNSLINTFKKLLNRFSEPVIRQAITEAMKILGKQFVMGESIEEALNRAPNNEKRGYCYSYDMLGEEAKTTDDAKAYLESYKNAIEKIANTYGDLNLGLIKGPGISVKLSALHPRFEWVNRDRIQKELYPVLKSLVLQAKEANISFTIDAEEAARLELSLLLVERLIKEKTLEQWPGFGMAVQAYQKRALPLLNWLEHLVTQENQPMMIRLVKGAYWDSEIKWTQERGLKGYPVFTRKSSTDVSYLAAAKKLISMGPLFYPQFATHNAYSVAAILEMVSLSAHKANSKTNSNSHPDKNYYNNADEKKIAFEFQCLHGMGLSLYDHIVGQKNLNIPCRIYAPVGSHEHLLSYLVRRLLENGANTSFVNRIIDEELPIEDLIADPVKQTQNLSSIPHPQIPLPKDLYGKERPNSSGIDITNPLEIDPLLTEVNEHFTTLFKDPVPNTSVDELENIIKNAEMSKDEWNTCDKEFRAKILAQLAEILGHHRSQLIALLIREGGKTIPDSISEVREAIDFCWYYRERLLHDFKPILFKGPTGELNTLQLYGRGIIACVSPWNFPLAIFLGQVVAALAASNCVIAKPASQTPRIAKFVIELLYQAGFPKNVVNVVVGSGATIGDKLISDPRISGMMFTGSTETATHINLTLAKRKGPIIPLIAETGGQNAMIVDSSALPEQVVSDVLTSAFNSAGQRCSALRVLFIQEEVADKIITMLKGAMQEVKIGDPALLSTDVGPVIDKKSYDTLMEHVEMISKIAPLIYECQIQSVDFHFSLGPSVFFAPRLFEINSIELLKKEVFGPILHVIRYRSENLDKVLDSINNTGYGLTFGIHSRIDEMVEYIKNRLHVGNIYVNRNMIGAVVGVQPFGGEGLSGTGPKAGGPHMLPRLAVERTCSINTAAAGNVTLMTL